MYLGVDVGGTKTLVAALDEHGVILEETKFPTPKKYDHFLLELRHTLAHFNTREFVAGGIAVPATVFDRTRGVGVRFGNLPWRNVPVQVDLERICHCPFVIENDAKLAGLSEAMLLREDFQKVLYVTVSTGIGYALINNQAIDPSVGDGGGALLMLEHRGKLVPWESFASGRAIVERYGKQAKDITDQTTWQHISRELAQGLVQLIAITEPQVIVIGGSVGNYFDRYNKLLATELKKYHLPLLTLPKLRQAQRPDHAVIYGCYDLAKQVYRHAHAH
jgi:glucokinase